MSQTIQRVPRRHPDAAFRVMDGQGIVAVAGRSEVHLLNAVGTRVYELVDGKRDVAEITRILRDEFEPGAADVASDVAEFLADMTARGMLE